MSPPETACPICGVSMLLKFLASHVASERCMLRFAGRVREGLGYHDPKIGVQAEHLKRQLVEILRGES